MSSAENMGSVQNNRETQLADASTSTDSLGGYGVIDPYLSEPWWCTIPMLPPPTTANVWDITRAVIPNPTCVNPSDPPFYFRTYHFNCEYCTSSWTSDLLKAETGLFCQQCCHFIRPCGQSDHPPPFIAEDIPSYGEFWSTGGATSQEAQLPGGADSMVVAMPMQIFTGFPHAPNEEGDTGMETATTNYN